MRPTSREGWGGQSQAGAGVSGQREGMEYGGFQRLGAQCSGDDEGQAWGGVVRT